MTSNPFTVVEIARQRQDELARQTRSGHVLFVSRRLRPRGRER